MKTCKTCKNQKSLDGFYSLKQMADGLTSECKECIRSRVRAREIKLRNTDKTWLKNERQRCREKQDRIRQQNRDTQTSYFFKNNWRKRNPKKVKASRVARALLKSGMIKKQEICSDCGATGKRLEMHHPDYSRHHFVVWLCCKCHGKTKRKIN